MPFERAIRSVSHQMRPAKLPMQRDLAGFDVGTSPVDRKLVTTLADTAFTHHCHIAEAGNQSIRCSRSTADAKKRIKVCEQAREGSKPLLEPDDI